MVAAPSGCGLIIIGELGTAGEEATAGELAMAAGLRTRAAASGLVSGCCTAALERSGVTPPLSGLVSGRCAAALERTGVTPALPGLGSAGAGRTAALGCRGLRGLRPGDLLFSSALMQPLLSCRSQGLVRRVYLSSNARKLFAVPELVKLGHEAGTYLLH